MLTIPWTSRPDPRLPSRGSTPQPDELPVVVQVSRLNVRSARHVPALFVTALRIRRATLRSPGSLGLSLRAQPLKLTFWTLSAWTDDAAIDGFVGSDAHRAVMVEYRDRMAGAHFHTWSDTGADAARPRWSDAVTRFNASLEQVATIS